MEQTWRSLPPAVSQTSPLRGLWSVLGRERGRGRGEGGREQEQVCPSPCGPFLTSFSLGQHLNKEFLPANSLQRVPVLKDGDFVLSERYSPYPPPPKPPAHWPLALPLQALPDPTSTHRGPR